MTDNPLTRIPVITQAILDAQPLEFHADNIGKLGHYLRYLSGKLDATIELKNNAAEAQLRICRNAGLRFPEMAKRGGNGSNQHGSKEQIVSYRPLADYGFKKYRANLCRRIAAIPEELFENEIMTIRTTEHLTGREITMAYFVEMEWTDRAHKAGINTDRPYRPPPVEIDMELVRVVHEATCGVLMAYIPATVYYQIEEAGLLRQSLLDAIEEYKAQQARKDNGNG